MDDSPTARALRTLDLIHNRPGVTAAEVADPLAIYVTWSDRRPLSPEAVIFRDWLLSQGALS